MSTLVIETRNATLEDAPQLASVFRKSWTHTYQGIMPAQSLKKFFEERQQDWWTNIIKKSASSICVCHYDGKIVGYSTQGKARRKSSKYPAEVFELYLLPEYQGAGLGKQLFMTAAKRLAEKGHHGFHIWMMTENTLGCQFLEHMGGKVVARAAQAFGDKKLPLQAYGFEITKK